MLGNQLRVTFKSAPNIALVKYWGKFSQVEIIPINDSLGLTLNTEDLSSVTTISFCTQIQQDTFILNHKPSKINNRMINVLGKVREKARGSLRFKEMSQQEWDLHHFRIESENSFPSASGMASSASGFSCLAAGLNHLFGNIFNTQELSRLARTGSGSASRAVFGGLVRWLGVNKNLFDSNQPITEQQTKQISKQSISFSLYPAEQLSFIRVIALVTQNKQKQVSSTVGMRTSMQTSEFIKYRNQIANSRIERISELIKLMGQSRKEKLKEKEYALFNQFSELIIRDSNSFHAVCLDTYPPIFYINQFSQQIIRMVDQVINKQTRMTKMAYTFDAGPHGFLFVHEDMLQDVLWHIYSEFGSHPEVLNEKARKMIDNHGQKQGTVFSRISGCKIQPKGIWVTDVGRGAQPL